MSELAILCLEINALNAVRRETYDGREFLVVPVVAQIEGVVRKLAREPYGPEKAEEIVEELVSGKYTHDFPITAEEACGLFGDCVHRELPIEVYNLMNLYKMEARPRRPSVEFVPSAPLKGE